MCDPKGENAQKLKFRQAVFSHERREANKEAHVLARLATTLDVGRHVWFINPPPDMNIPVNIINV